MKRNQTWGGVHSIYIMYAMPIMLLEVVSSKGRLRLL